MTVFPVGERCSSTVVGGHHHGAEATDNQKERERGPGREGGGTHKDHENVG